MSHADREDVVGSPEEIDGGDILVQETNHVPSTENVPKFVGDGTEAQVWRSGDGPYRIFLRTA
jgi:hypothetical protein